MADGDEQSAMAGQSYVYLRSKFEPLYTVGFFDPAGKWHAESDHGSQEQAAARVHYLNGGTPENEK